MKILVQKLISKFAVVATTVAAAAVHGPSMRGIKPERCFSCHRTPPPRTGEEKLCTVQKYHHHTDLLQPAARNYNGLKQLALLFIAIHTFQGWLHVWIRYMYFKWIYDLHVELHFKGTSFLSLHINYHLEINKSTHFHSEVLIFTQIQHILS